MSRVPFLIARPYRSWLRIVIVTFACLLFVAGAALILLQMQGLLNLTPAWLSNVVLLLTLLSVICAIFQWTLPFPPISSPPSIPDASSDSVNSVALAAAHPAEPADAAARLHKAFRHQTEQELDPYLPKGILIVYMDERCVAQDVRLISQHAWVHSPPTQRDQLQGICTAPVKRYPIRDSYVCAAVFRNLDQDDYAVWFDGTQPIFVLVIANKVMSIDLR